MATVQHDGNRLRYFFDKYEGKTKDVIEKMGFKDYTGLYYYYNREEIKSNYNYKRAIAI